MAERESLYREALAHYDRDRYAEAAEAFARLLGLPPDSSAPPRAEVQYKLANALGELGDWEGAARNYELALAQDPAHAEALNNLGAARQHLGRAVEAEACYRRAMVLRPTLPAPYMNLGRLLQSQGRESDAASLYQAALDAGLDRGLFGHLLEATRGHGASRAPQAYVRQTFDAFANQFDRHLTDALDYRVPQRLAALILEAGAAQPAEVLDLGCGTGLVGQALSGPAQDGQGLDRQGLDGRQRLVGVDASPRMLAAAARRGLYAELHEADIEAWLASAPRERFDVVVAADVFIYIGRLDGVFAAVADVLRARGRFAFSIETCEGDDWRLLPSGRYAQSERYVARLAQRHGFAMQLQEPEVIRKGVPGALHVLAKT